MKFEVFSQFDKTDVTITFSNKIQTSNLHKKGPIKIDVCLKSLENKFNSRILALKAFLLEEIYNENHYEMKLKSDTAEKDKVSMLNCRSNCWKHNNSLKNEINNKQAFIDPVVRHNSNLLRRHCSDVKQGIIYLG